jgi:hypothetical protein
MPASLNGAWRTPATPQAIEDACSHAWLQLLTHLDVACGL